MNLPRDNKSSFESEVTLAPGQSLPRGSSLSRVHVNRPLVVQLDLRTAADQLFAMFTVQLKNVYRDSLVLLEQGSCFQTLSWS